MADPTPRVTPYLLYEDVNAALDWLTKAFGLRENSRMAGSDGKVRHAEMLVGPDGMVLMGWPGAEYRNPKHLGQHTQYLYVAVEDGIDEHFERAVRAGAVVLERPADQPYGARRYGVEDPEGHRWYFAQPIRKSAG